jgi:hypothetical protein
MGDFNLRRSMSFYRVWQKTALLVMPPRQAIIYNIAIRKLVAKRDNLKIV